MRIVFGMGLKVNSWWFFLSAAYTVSFICRSTIILKSHGLCLYIMSVSCVVFELLISIIPRKEICKHVSEINGFWRISYPARYQFLIN